MTLPDRKAAEVRRMLEGPHPAVPPDLALRCAQRGRLILRHRRLARRAWWLICLVALTAFVVWSIVEQPWTPAPVDTTPPLEGW